MKRKLALKVLVFTLLFSQAALADKFNTETSSSGRALGMGDAGINTERGAYAVFYNPANIAAKDTGTHFQAVNFQLDGDGALLAQGKPVNFTNLQSLYSDLKNNTNTYAGGRYSVYPNITMRNFSIGMLYESNQGAEVRASDGALRVKARDRFAPTAALSYRLLSGILRLGASAQLLTVGDADAVDLAPGSGLDYKQFINSGTGLDFTGGVTLTLPFRFLPSFSVVARNVGTTRYTHSSVIKFGDGSTLPDTPMTFDAATSLSIYLARRFEMKVEGDYRDVENKLEGGRFRHVFAGAEFLIYDILRLRAGIQHGYPTFGMSLVTRRASLDLAMYSEELNDRLRGEQDTRYVLQYTWEIFK
jgi:hypothetical protein